MALHIAAIGGVFAGAASVGASPDARLADIAPASEAAEAPGASPRTEAGARQPAMRAGNSRDRREQVADAAEGRRARPRKAKATPLAARLQQAGLNWTMRQFWIISGVRRRRSGFLLAARGCNAVVAGRRRRRPSPAASACRAGSWASCRSGRDQEVHQRLSRRHRRHRARHQVRPAGRTTASRSSRARAPEPLRRRVPASGREPRRRPDARQTLDKHVRAHADAGGDFFAIVMAIQQKTGGNLAEALGNLSPVLRDRKMMREKIKALSSEAMASAGIIGSLPPGVDDPRLRHDARLHGAAVHRPARPHDAGRRARSGWASASS